MRLTTMTDYALRLLIYLGRHPDRLCTIAEVAQAYQISEAHLTKITHQLGLGGWIQTVRGKGGGMRLALAPEQISVGRLECLGEQDDCSLSGRCRLTGILGEALAAFQQTLERYTLADLLAAPPARAARRQTVVSPPVRHRTT